MIYYFIHLINKILHLLYRDGAPSINHWSDGTDKLTDLFCIHTGLLGYSAERVFVICYFLYIYLNFSSQFFCKVDVLFMHQVGMIFLLKIKSSYQFGKFQRFVFRLVDDRNSRCLLRAVNTMKRIMVNIVKYKAHLSGL